MRNKLLSLLLILCSCLSISAQKTYVLSTGVSNYGDPNINLGNTTKDAKAFGALYKKQKNTSVSILTSSNANKANIKTHIDAIAKLSKPEDKVIFFFSGHGSPGCFIAYDGPFYYTELISILRTIKAKGIYVFVDACMSGSISDDATSYDWASNRASSISLMMSSRADEYSYETGWVTNGFFTQALLKALRGKSDTNRDRNITLMEAFKYVHKDVTDRTPKMHPQLIASSELFDTILTQW
ncbi:MAG: caspase family protein [Bacteroidaceae bacterium]|nr:caspase family protein [Bacteroidaceae bacterium]